MKLSPSAAVLLLAPVAHAWAPEGVTRRRTTVLRAKFQPETDTQDRSPSASKTALFSGFPLDSERLGSNALQHLDDAIEEPSFVENILSTYWGPRIVLLTIAGIYATNFPLGAILNDNLPASAATASRLFLATLALGPFVGSIAPHLRLQAVACGCFTALGYITQSLALVDTDPAKVSFLGSATVLVCPLLELLVDKKPLGPQTWVAAVLCLMGVGLLELPSDAAAGLVQVGGGDVLALIQAVGFGTGVFWTSKMIAKDPDQSLSVTSVLIATAALVSMVWALLDGWMFQPGWEQYTLWGLWQNPDMHTVAYAVLWTGVISTSLNFFIEITALGRVPPSEASVLLATEPLWAALFAAMALGGTLETNDYLGGAFLVLSCLVNGVLQPKDFQFLQGASSKDE